MTDLTQNTSAFGLLSTEDQEAFRAHVRAGGEISIFSMGGDWKILADPPAFFNTNIYRTVPLPPKPKEIWVNEYQTFISGYATKEMAERCAYNAGLSTLLRMAVRYREVME